MMITGTTSTPSTSNSSTAAQGSGGALDENAFLNLMMTQMQNQDPLSPMDNTTFLSQLAQFSSLEQMQNLNSSFNSSLSQNQMLNDSVAAGLIGRNVVASGNTVSLPASGGTNLSYTLPSTAAAVTLTVTDANGNTVCTLPATNTAAGSHSVAWDGRSSSGLPEPAGTYGVSVSAVDANGKSVAATTQVQGVVSGVTYSNGTAYLDVNGQQIALSNVSEVTAAGTGSN